VKKTCGECESLHTAGALIGRFLLSLIFILAGFGKITGFSEAVDSLKQMNIPAAHLLIVITIIIELGCGLLILFGWYTRLASWILVIFLIPVTLMFHDFWNYEQEEMVVQMSNFLKNLSIMGGLILLACYGSGRWSLDAKQAKHCYYKENSTPKI
jgi:putative oxidoreductase